MVEAAVMAMFAQTEHYDLYVPLVMLIIISYFMKTISVSTTKEITYNEFISMVEDGKVRERQDRG